MNGSAGHGLRTFVLDGSRGPLLAVYHSPQRQSHRHGDLLCVPAFGEEMNRCRAMVTLQARALAQIGVGTLVVDPYGTGDSAGEFGDATWQVWREDLTAGISWLRTRGNGCRAVWGVRLGAIMAAELALSDEGLERMLLWQPVLDGKSFFTQFLRIRIAAEMNIPDGVRTTEELRRRSASGESIEVSGYCIGPELAAELDSIRLPDAARLARLGIDWLEVLPSADSRVARTSVKVVDQLRAAGAELTLGTVVGPPFWQVHERETAPELVAATTAAVSAWSGGQVTLVGDGDRLDLDPDPDPGEVDEAPLQFPCDEDVLAGVMHFPDPAKRRTRGVVIVVAGGPQYRVGAHRQFVSLARKLSGSGYPVLRFDLRGMGDSTGDHLGYQHSEGDIRAAIDAQIASDPGIEEVVLFGECESASGILFFAWNDPRVKGIVLVNPWVRTEEGQAQVVIKHYYLDRLRSKEFWMKVRAGQFDVIGSFGSLVSVLRNYFRGRRMASQSRQLVADEDLPGLPLPERTAAGLRRFRGQVMILMSGNDYIAREFDEVTTGSRAWRGVLSGNNVCRRDLAGADHTFSRAAWKNQASEWVVEWLERW